MQGVDEIKMLLCEVGINIEAQSYYCDNMCVRKNLVLYTTKYIRKKNTLKIVNKR